MATCKRKRWCSDQVVEDSRHALFCSANWLWYAMNLIQPNQLDRQLCRRLAKDYLIQRGETGSEAEFVEQIKKPLAFFGCGCIIGANGHYCQLSNSASLLF